MLARVRAIDGVLCERFWGRQLWARNMSIANYIGGTDSWTDSDSDSGVESALYIKLQKRVYQCINVSITNVVGWEECWYHLLLARISPSHHVSTLHRPYDNIIRKNGSYWVALQMSLLFLINRSRFTRISAQIEMSTLIHAYCLVLCRCFCYVLLPIYFSHKLKLGYQYHFFWDVKIIVCVISAKRGS